MTMTQLLLAASLLYLQEESGKNYTLSHKKSKYPTIWDISDYWVANRFQNLVNCLIKSSQAY